MASGMAGNRDIRGQMSERTLLAPVVDTRAREWQRFYYADRPHSSLGGRSPSERLQQLRHKVPSIDVIRAAYDPKREWDRPHEYRWGM
jgi:hypothetical protein